MENNIKWSTVDNEQETATLAQHAFKGVKRRLYYEDAYYDSNISLCGRIRISENGQSGISIDAVDGEPMNPHTSCKNCLKIYTRLLNPSVDRTK